MKIVAVDFDGTIVKSAFPDIGDPLPGAIETLRDLIAAGYKLVLYTCREDEKKRKYLSEAVAWCAVQDIHFRSVNQNHRDDDFRENIGRKVYANIYIDDKNIDGFPGWDWVRQKLLG